VDTLKTVFVVGLLGVVLYGAYALLSKKEGTPPPEVVGLTENLDDLSAPEVDLGPSLTPGLPDTELASYGNLSVDVDASPTDVQIPSYEQEPKKPVVIGGIIQGATGIGGPPVVALLLSRGEDPATTRGNIVVMMSSMVIIALPFLWIYGLISARSLILGSFAAPIYLLATYLGFRYFQTGGSGIYRTMALLILALTAISTLVIGFL